MDELRTRAQLVAFDPAVAGAIGTVLTRAEITETAGQGEFPATLLLDLDRADPADGGEVTAYARVAVDWDEDTLDQLLASTEASEIALWFDERDLALAFEEGEVEAHGLRQRAAVLTVAVAAAGMSATPAFARHVEDAVGPVAKPASASVTQQAGRQGLDAWDAGAVRGLLKDHEITVPQTPPTTAGAPASTPSGDGGLSSGEISALEAVGAALLISAAGFGVARKRKPPVQPA
jgi:hypothetical protein